MDLLHRKDNLCISFFTRRHIIYMKQDFLQWNRKVYTKIRVKTCGNNTKNSYHVIFYVGDLGFQYLGEGAENT